MPSRGHVASYPEKTNQYSTVQCVVEETSACLAAGHTRLLGLNTSSVKMATKINKV
jgi:hypothetical protein